MNQLTRRPDYRENFKAAYKGTRNQINRLYAADTTPEINS